jgi:transposase
MKPSTSSAVTEPNFAAFISIDWANAKHAYALSLPEGSSQEQGQFTHTPEAIGQWVEDLRTRFGDQPIAIATELTRGPLIWALLEHPTLHLYTVTPQSSAQFRKALHPSGAKSDPADTLVLLTVLMRHRDQLRRVRLEDAKTRLLAQLNRDRRDAVEQRTACVQRLTATLKEYFPLFLELVGPLKNDAPCRFLLKWGSLQELQEARLQDVRKFLYGLNCRYQIKERLALIAPAKPLTTDSVVIECGRRKAQLQAELILELNKSVDEYDARIKELFQDHPDRELFNNLPGCGAALAPRLLTAFGLDRSRFHSATELSAYSGIAPIEISSGKTKYHRRRIACPEFLRQSFHEHAAQAARFCPWSRKYYAIQLAKGKSHHQAVRSLAFKWQRVLFAGWINNTPYNQALYLQSLRKSGSPYAVEMKEAA